LALFFSRSFDSSLFVLVFLLLFLYLTVPLFAIYFPLYHYLLLHLLFPWLLFSTVHFCLLFCSHFLFIRFHLPLTIFIFSWHNKWIVFWGSWAFLGLEQPFPGHRVTLKVELPYIGFLPMSTWLKSKMKFRMYSQPSGGNFEKSLTTCLRASTPPAMADANSVVCLYYPMSLPC
jgi:hypothetical protein